MARRGRMYPALPVNVHDIVEIAGRPWVHDTLRDFLGNENAKSAQPFPLVIRSSAVLAKALLRTLATLT
jgi:hypothetical protein